MEDGRLKTSAACLRFETELEAYLDGESQPFITSHARDCGFCNVLLTELQMIRQAAADLPLAEPSPAVWANIHAQLEAEGAFRQPMGLWHRLFSGSAFPHAVPVGVLASLVILASALTVPRQNDPRWDASESAAASTALATTAELSPSEDVALAQVVGDLEVNYHANERSLAPEMKATYEKSLISLNDSIRECRDSLHHEPSNTLTHDYLLTAYTRKAEILTSALEFEGVNGR